MPPIGWLTLSEQEVVTFLLALSPWKPAFRTDLHPAFFSVFRVFSGKFCPTATASCGSSSRPLRNVAQMPVRSANTVQLEMRPARCFGHAGSRFEELGLEANADRDLESGLPDFQAWAVRVGLVQAGDVKLSDFAIRFPPPIRVGPADALRSGSAGPCRQRGFEYDRVQDIQCAPLEVNGQTLARCGT